MIIKCEKCESEFNLDENLLKAGGSKVRCSVCKNAFTAYPPEPERDEEPAPAKVIDEALEETVALDSLPVFEEEVGPEPSEGPEDAFDKAFEDALEEEGIPDVSLDEAPEPGETADQPAGIAEEVGAEKAEVLFERPEDLEIPETVPPIKRPGRSRVLLTALVVVLVLVVGAIAVFFLAPNLIPISSLRPVEKEEITDMGALGLDILKDSSLECYFVQSGKSGSLFVIKGTVINNYLKSRGFILLKGSILNDKGKTIGRKLAYAGNIFSEKQLKEMPMEEINKQLKFRFGKDKINFNVKPGATVPFMIVFDKLPKDPDRMREFEVEPISSSPGK
ncbi:MAG: zinc-ribbon domain-containing protein [Deltaproteobacteria bacterium]|nr:zinc-ribbon domain-containing protein [Deltaproteobacteria bacterium]